MADRKRNKNLQQYRQVRVRSTVQSSRFSAQVIGWSLVVFSFFGVLSIGYKSLASSAAFHASNIRVEGVSRLDKKEILKLGNIDIHTNVLALNPVEIQKKIEAHEWVEQVDVVRELPGTLEITVKERKAVAMINLQNTLYYVDRKGSVFAKVQASDDHDFPVITGLKKENLQKNDTTESSLLDVLQFLKYASRGDALLPKQNVSEMHVSDSKGLIVFLVDRPFPIYLGKGKICTKYHRLAKVLHKLYKKELFAETTYIRMDYAVNKVLVGRKEFAG